MRILVTGAAGFIGGHLARRLAERGDTVVGLDNFDPYYDPARKRAQTERLKTLHGVDMIEEDIRDRTAMARVIANGNFDAIAHLAALAGVRAAVEDPARYVDVDLNGTQSVMDAARAGGVDRIVFSSTSSVYGRTERLPFREDDACDHPLQPYAAAKRAAEMLGFSYHNLFGMNFTAVRLFTVYGPHNRPDMMLYSLAQSMHGGDPIPLYQEGHGIFRDWTFVEDIVDGIERALDRPLGYKVINLGRGEAVELAKFVAILTEVAGAAPRVTPAPLPTADMPQTFADITRARELLGYAPHVSVREGISAFWSWYAHEVLQPSKS